VGTCRKCDVVLTEENTYPNGNGGRTTICKECDKDRTREWSRNNSEKKRESQIAFWRKLRREVFSIYGERCACCGEERWEFLTIDHVSGNGAEHRKEIRGKNHGGGGGHFYLWLRKNGYPRDGYRTLCWNCNAARGVFGYCPHERENTGVEKCL